MSVKLKIALWNANGLTQHRLEVETFLINHKIDIMLISESRFTNRSYIQIPKYKIYDTKHPGGGAHGGTAIIIKANIKHNEIQKYEHDYLQATSIIVEDWNGPITISAVYCPPKHTISHQIFSKFFSTLGNKFIAGGDYNAKHQQWGSRLATTRGRELRKSIIDGNLGHISSGEPTYWPTDRNKIPDLLDFAVTKNISSNYITAESCLDLSSDHSSVIFTLDSEILRNSKPPSLCSRLTNWNLFKNTLDESISLSIPLKTPDDLDQAVQHLCVNIQSAAWKATPTQLHNQKEKSFPPNIMDKIAEKRRLRKRWQTTRAPGDKLILNRAVKDIKRHLEETKNQAIQQYLEKLTPTQATDYSLWKATKKLKQPIQHIPSIRANNEWARNAKQKADLFANHLAKVFTPHTSTNNVDLDDINKFLDSPFQMELPMKNFKIREIKSIIKSEINAKKAPGFDLITGKILKELPDVCLKLITMLFNAIIRLSYFPSQWKVAQIIMIQKPGKKENEVESYRPISLLPILSKLFEKAFLKRLKPILIDKNLIPAHQFGFREQHATVEQVHRLINIITRALEGKRYCSAAFLDISQAFDKVWHAGLLYKLKSNLPPQFYEVIKSYISNRHFFVKIQEEQSQLFSIKAGVPQGSVLGPVLYLLFTADLPTTHNTSVATFADDTAVMSSHRNASTASKYLQDHLNLIQQWLSKWRIKANETKSSHVTFTMKRETCPPVFLNNQQLPQTDDTKYLGMHLDRRLTWKKHIFTKRKQLGLRFQKMYWLMGRNSKLTLENKLLLYKMIIKPIWTYGIQLWGTASNSNIEILQRFQSKVLRNIANAPWFVPNTIIQHDLKMCSVNDEIKNYCQKYKKRLMVHPNELAVNLLDTQNDTRRLKRFKPLDLSERF